MKSQLTILSAACGIIACIGAFALPAQADSFYVTNYLSSTTGISSYPTNYAGTNGIPVATGLPVSLANYDSAGLYFKALSLTTNTTTVTVQLVRSQADNHPQITIATNGQTTAMEWETASLISLPITLPANSTNAFYWGTNLNSDLIKGWNWIGVYSLTNTLGNLTNVEIGINKKIMPVRFP